MKNEEDTRVKGYLFGVMKGFIDHGEEERLFMVKVLETYFAFEETSFEAEIKGVLDEEAKGFDLTDEEMNLYVQSESHGLSDRNLTEKRTIHLLKMVVEKVKNYGLLAKIFKQKLDANSNNFSLVEILKGNLPPEIYKSLLTDFALNVIEKKGDVTLSLGEYLAAFMKGNFLNFIFSKVSKPRAVLANHKKEVLLSDRYETIKGRVASLDGHDIYLWSKVLTESLGTELLTNILAEKGSSLAICDLTKGGENKHRQVVDFFLQVLDYLAATEEPREKILGILLLSRLNKIKEPEEIKSIDLLRN